MYCFFCQFSLLGTLGNLICIGFDDAKEFKNQEKFQVSSFQESRIKNNQKQNSRLKIKESREDLIKINMKSFFKKK